MCNREPISNPLSVLTLLTTERFLNKTDMNGQHETSVELNFICVGVVYIQIFIFLSCL